MSLLKKIKRYSVFYFVTSLGMAFPVSAQVFTKASQQEMAVKYIAEQIGEHDSEQIHLSALPLDSRIPDLSLIHI